ncbi:MAG TPA: hypothetical protein ENL06_03010 [Candidatus Portnoybacteria bacterium]|nr:hypothetical protein [Candidatus Portnoybacteria bacterium]
MFKINYFYQDINDKLDLDDIPLDKKEEIAQKLTNIIQKKVLLRVADLLPDEKKEEFNKIIESDNQEEIDQFFSQNIPNIQEIINEEIETLKRELKKEKEDNENRTN